ncbi:MAG: porin family protein [Pseudomonadota bacterium]
MNRALAMTSALVAVAALPAMGAHAQGFYVDGGYTFIGIDVEDAGTSFDADIGAITGHAGFDINEFLAVEGEVGVGVDDEEVSAAGIDAELGLNYLVGAYGKAQYPVSETISLYARAGVVNAELEAEVSGAGSDSASDTGFGFGVGADAYLSDRGGIRVDYTRYDIEDLEADAFSVGYKFRF